MERSNYTVTDFSCWASTDPRMQLSCLWRPLVSILWLCWKCQPPECWSVMTPNCTHPRIFSLGICLFWISGTPLSTSEDPSDTHLWRASPLQAASPVLLWWSWLACSECCLLAAMAADRCTFISKPPVYSQAMSMKLCAFFCSCLIPWWLY